jgi:hypothetical protein
MSKTRELVITIIRDIEVLEIEEGKPLYCGEDCTWYAYDGLFFVCHLFQEALSKVTHEGQLLAVRCADCQDANARELPTPAS